MTTETMIGIDLAKSVFQVHGASMTAQLKFRKKLSRVQFRKFMAEHPAATVVMEACGSVALSDVFAIAIGSITVVRFSSTDGLFYASDR